MIREGERARRLAAIPEQDEHAEARRLWVYADTRARQRIDDDRYTEDLPT